MSTIGLLLSIAVIVFGLQRMNSTNSSSSNSNSNIAATKSNGVKISSNCYEFNLPTMFIQSDIKMNSDCITMVVKSDSTEDVFVNSTTVNGTITEANTLPTLKNIGSKLETSFGSQIVITKREVTTLNGVQAYKLTGTESKGNYKYAGILIALSPIEYDSASGKKLKAFIVGYDSSSNPNLFDDFIPTFKWQ